MNTQKSGDGYELGSADPVDANAALQQNAAQAADAAKQEKADRYWQSNLSLLTKLLAVWFLVSFGFGILLVDTLNAVEFMGVKLGFWFAQQGSIYVFVALIFIYARQMKKLEREFGVDD